MKKMPVIKYKYGKKFCCKNFKEGALVFGVAEKMVFSMCAFRELYEFSLEPLCPINYGIYPTLIPNSYEILLKPLGFNKKFDRFNPLCECDSEEDFLIVPKTDFNLYRIITFKQAKSLFIK